MRPVIEMRYAHSIMSLSLFPEQEWDAFKKRCNDMALSAIVDRDNAEVTPYIFSVVNEVEFKRCRP